MSEEKFNGVEAGIFLGGIASGAIVSTVGFRISPMVTILGLVMMLAFPLAAVVHLCWRTKVEKTALKEINVQEELQKMIDRLNNAWHDYVEKPNLRNALYLAGLMDITERFIKRVEARKMNGPASNIH